MHLYIIYNAEKVQDQNKSYSVWVTYVSSTLQLSGHHPDRCDLKYLEANINESNALWNFMSTEELGC